MSIKVWIILLSMCVSLIFFSCRITSDAPGDNASAGEPSIHLVTLDPGHFHAALVQKRMYPQISSKVHVYAPEGFEVDTHLNLVRSFNARQDEPTGWEEVVYTGDDFLEKMLEENKGNMVVLAGNNKRKPDYIKACVSAGLNVFADKPMCIDTEGYNTLLEAFDLAAEKNVLIYDIMTERSEITTILQKELAHIPEVSGEIVKGTLDEPAIVKESVHHFFKYVSGKPLQRPAWAFDVNQQGEGIVDVTNHLLDLIMWEAFTEQAINREDVEITAAKRWPTVIKPEQFAKVTGVDEFPEYLQGSLNDKGDLLCFANGQIDYKLKGINCRVVVKWDFEAPEGAKDTHYSIMSGSQANIIIRQGAEQNYRPELYVEAVAGVAKESIADALASGIENLKQKYAGLELVETDAGWQVMIPDEFRIGHEAHFSQVMERYLGYLEQGTLPEWELVNMKTKYFMTTQALEKAMAGN